MKTVYIIIPHEKVSEDRQASFLCCRLMPPKYHESESGIRNTTSENTLVDAYIPRSLRARSSERAPTKSGS